MKILVCSSGFSSLKFSLFEADNEVLSAEGGIDWATNPRRLVGRRPRQIDCQNYAHENGIDTPEVDQWTWHGIP